MLKLAIVAVFALGLLPGIAQARSSVAWQVQNAALTTGSGDQVDARQYCIPGRGQGKCTPPRPGHTQPPCEGAHMGPNGVMIQCE